MPGIDGKRKRRAVWPGRRFGGVVDPAMDFGVAVREGDIRRAIVVGRRQIPPFHIVQAVKKITVIDAVRMFVQEDEDGVRVGKIRRFLELLVVRIEKIGAIP